MSKKSASQLKVLKESVPEASLPPIEETFENVKQVFVNTLEVSVTLAKRVDNLLNIRDYAINFWKDTLYMEQMLPKDRMEYFRKLQRYSVNCYEMLLAKAKSFKLEDFLKEDMPDYFEDVLLSDEDIKNEEDLCLAGLVFLTVKPWGEKMTAMHHTMLDEKKQREFSE